MDPYDRLVWEVWMPKFRHTLSSLSLLEFTSIIDLLEVWLPLLPVWQMENILEQMISPRLQHGVQGWDPTTDTVPLHTWVHPWLPLMGWYIHVQCIYMNMHSTLAKYVQCIIQTCRKARYNPCTLYMCVYC